MSAGWRDGAVVRPCGEAAVSLEWGDTIDDAAGRSVARATAALDRSRPDGLVELVPTFRALLVVFDPDRTTADALLAAVAADEGPEATQPTTWRVPVCLNGAAAEDLAEAAAILRLAPDEVRSRLVAQSLRVGMYGFAPGFAYLSGIDPALAIPRRATPRRPMPSGSVIIAGGMAALASAAMPTGWYVVGRTAVAMFRPDADPMVPFAVGDRVRFDAVSAEALAAFPSPSGGVEAVAS